jgi:hypothetical protein
MASAAANDIASKKKGVSLQGYEATHVSIKLPVCSIIPIEVNFSDEHQFLCPACCLYCVERR